MTFKLRYVAPFCVAGAAAAGIAVAPTANANPRICTSVGTATICEKQGHTSIVTHPPMRRAQLPVYDPFLPPHYPLR